MREGKASNFGDLRPDQQERYLEACRQLTKLALDHAVPIVFAPPIGRFAVPLPGNRLGTVTLPLTYGKIESASGCILNLRNKHYVVTADHVLEDYEKRTRAGEMLNWQVGDLKFDPLSRIAWRGTDKRIRKDIVFLALSEQEAKEACADRTYLLSAPIGWPGRAPQEGELVALAGYPTQLREVDGGIIRPGPLSTMLQVTTSTGDGTFKCRYSHEDLISYDPRSLPLEGLCGNLGGISGGPVFGVGNISYPFVGVVSERCPAYAPFDTIVVEAVEGVPSNFDS